MPELALVLATYNETDNLPPLVEALENLGEDLHLAAGFKIGEVPIIFTGRRSGESKMDKGQAVKGITLCAANVLRYLLRLGRFSRR